MPIPIWINVEAWNGFVEMRRSIKKPMSPRAMTMAVNKLAEFKAKGHDPNAVLDQSTFYNWQDLYPVKAEVIPNLIHEPKPKEAPMTQEQKEAADKARRMAMSAIKLVRTA